MLVRTIKTDYDVDALVRLVQNRRRPFTVQIQEGIKRSDNQNRTQRLWLLEAEQQGDMTAEEYRGYCKLVFGVPILRAENELFREKYDSIIKPLPYEAKIQMMMEPLDFPITRLMTTKQKTAYLDRMYQHFRGLGFILTEPGP